MLQRSIDTWLGVGQMPPASVSVAGNLSVLETTSRPLSLWDMCTSILTFQEPALGALGLDGVRVWCDFLGFWTLLLGILTRLVFLRRTAGLTDSFCDSPSVSSGSSTAEVSQRRRDRRGMTYRS
jgi:hypothetical protein